jgi:poly(3-hydroxyalkanoate) synthetase
MDDTQGNQRNTTKTDFSNDKNIAQLEKLLDQSMMGFHHLFDNERIAEILKTPTEKMDFFTNENMELIQKIFDRLIVKQTVEEKHAYIESLDNKEFEILLRSYFHIVDSTIMSGEHTRH